MNAKLDSKPKNIAQYESERREYIYCYERKEGDPNLNEQKETKKKEERLERKSD